MRILLDCRPLQEAGADSEKTRFVLSCTSVLSARGVEWFFLLDKKGGDMALSSKGKRLVHKAFPGVPGQKLWYNWLIPRLVRQYKAELVMITGERAMGSDKTPQFRWTMATVPTAPEEGVVSLSFEERERVKLQVAAGREFFFADITGVKEADVVQLLKAFSLFKKRQLSNMKLLLAGTGEAGLPGKLESYKYREDVALVPVRGEAAAAYAVVDLVRRDGLGLGVLNAWKAGVPVIAFESREGVLSVGAGDPALLADGLKSLYKDEALRNELIRQGAVGVADLSLGQSAARIWDAIGQNQ